MTALEVIGTLFALLGVWLTTRQNIWCWPVSIIAIVIYIYIFFQSKIYGDSVLQIFYLAMSFYGWYEWRYASNSPNDNTGDTLILDAGETGKNKPELFVNTITLPKLIYTLVAGTMGTFVLFFFLTMTDSNIVWLDAISTSFSLVATWMMARKILENWICWIILDLLYVGIYIYKGLYVTSVQYFIFTILAAYGYWQWKKELTTKNW